MSDTQINQLEHDESIPSAKEEHAISHGTTLDAWFDQLEHDEDTASPEEAQALKDFLEDKSPADQAARILVSGVGTEQSPDATKIWSLLLDAAEGIPESQPKLVEILEALKRMDGVAFTMGNGKQENWSELPGFASDLSDSRRAIEARFASRSDPRFAACPQRYARLSAFAAQLTVRKVINLCLWAMEDCHSALEVDHSANIAMLDGYLPAAAEWVNHAGPLLAQWTEKYPDPHGDVQRSTTLWTGDKTHFSKERWDFWKARFEAIANLPIASQATRDVARKAGETMSR